MTLDEQYAAEWFKGHYALRVEYRIVADAIHEEFSVIGMFMNVIDVGCGVGFIIERLKELGHHVTGLDGSANARDVAPSSVRENIMVCDITKPVPLMAADLVICTEVAEHMDPFYADRLVEVLCMFARGPIFFTAATPGQGGNGHVNEQPVEYWIEKFKAAGKQYSEEGTQRMRGRLEACKGMHWFPRNALVFG